MSWIESMVIRAGEKMGDMSVLPIVLASSRAAFWKLGMTVGLMSHRKHVSPTVWHVALIASVRAEDCGPCLQIAVNRALHAGVARDIVTAAARKGANSLPPLEADVFDFASAVARNAPVDEALRSRLASALSEKAFVDLAFAVITGRTFPTLKRAVGIAQSCSLVQIAV
jgi:hypothetical protein